MADNGKAVPRGAAFYISLRLVVRKWSFFAHRSRPFSRKDCLREGVYRRLASSKPPRSPMPSAIQPSQKWRHSRRPKLRTYATRT